VERGERGRKSCRGSRPFAAVEGGVVGRLRCGVGEVLGGGRRQGLGVSWKGLGTRVERGFGRDEV
jgi:hypothetical protein